MHAETPPLPADWLAVVATDDLDALFDQSDALLKQLRRPEWGALRVLRAGASLLPLSDGPLIVGLRGGVERVTPFALAPITDFDRLVESLGAEKVGSSALLVAPTGQGVIEIELAEPWKGWVLVRSAADVRDWPEQSDPRGLAPLLTMLRDQTLVAAVSAEGLEAADRYAQDSRNLLMQAGNRLRLAGWRYHGGWSAEQARTLVAIAAPLFEALNQEASAAWVGVSRDPSGEVSLKLTLDCRGDSPAESPAPSVAIEQGGRPAILDLPVPQDAAARRLATRLYLATVEMQPESIDLQQYPDTFRDFTSACLAVTDQVQSGRVLAISRATDSPLGANQVAALRVKDARQFSESLQQAVALWNKMLVDAQGNQNLTFQSENVEVAGRAATRYWANVIDPADADRVPEIKTTMRRFYGADGKASLSVVPLEDDLVAIADMTADDLAPWLDRFSRRESPSNEEGTIAIDHFINWQQQLWTAMMDGALGYKPAPDFPETPPCEVEINGGKVSVRLPSPLLEAVGERLPQ